MCVCTPSIPEWYCGQGDCIWPDERKPGHAAPVKKESEATEMSGETECDGINYDGRDEIKAAISVLRRFDNRHGHDFDGGDKSVCKAITKIETELVDLGRRANPPGYELVPEGTVDDLINVWVSFLTKKATEGQVNAVIRRFTAPEPTRKSEIIPAEVVDAICRLVSQYQVGVDCGEQGHLDGIEELIEFVESRATKKQGIDMGDLFADRDTGGYGQ